ncbi:hypothetical protein QAD02_016111 [Eretmocerus hayati]|uniref:Uncharacterized protein n=1 Tax=Eretmocerus hayati TaxID=131215 RepID=A0ACC2PAJ9_9HYME|nr:hypothetical protein QAD02_016111 [Eretmocerus hayati]
MPASGPCDYKLKLYGRGRASDALIQHRITTIGYEIYNCAGNSRLVRNKVPILQALRKKFMEALKNRAAAPSEDPDSDNSDSEEAPTLEDLEKRVSSINQASIKNRRDRAFCHYQIARLEAEIGALFDAQDYYRVPWFRSTDEEELEVKGYENTLVDEWVYVKLKDLKEQKKTFIEWRDELLYEAPKIRRDYHEAENALNQEFERLDQLRSSPSHQPSAHDNTASQKQYHQDDSPASPPFVTGELNPKFKKLPFGIRQSCTYWRCERATRRCEKATEECEKAAEGGLCIGTSCYADDISTSSTKE